MFEYWIKDRVLCVSINDQLPSWNRITAGVPWWSVLGPLLFLVFINDITDVITHCNSKLFADDAFVFIEVDNREQAAIKLNEDFYCATIAYHVGLNANSGGRRTPANDQEKWTFGFGQVRGCSHWPPYSKAYEITLKIFTVFSEYTYCWMFIFSYLLLFII